MNIMKVHFYATGRVQGVGYRFFVQQTAISLNIIGWVRNLFDGRVEVVAEGSEKNIKIFIEKCKTGPRFSKVLNLNFIEDDVKLEQNKFIELPNA